MQEMRKYSPTKQQKQELEGDSDLGANLIAQGPTRRQLPTSRDEEQHGYD